MSLKCDVTGSTDRVEKLPEYMQTDKIKKVCFRVAVKMEQERLNPKTEKPEGESEKPEKFDRKAAMKQAKDAGVNVAKNISNKELQKVIANLEGGE